MIFHRRKQATGKPAIYIHTSGTGVLNEDVRGKKGSNVVYNDVNVDQINALPDDQPHRDVDLFIIQATDANSLLKNVIIFPSLIYPILIQAALKQQQAETIGPGEATWNNVHIDDLVDAYVII